MVLWMVAGASTVGTVEDFKGLGKGLGGGCPASKPVLSQGSIHSGSFSATAHHPQPCSPATYSVPGYKLTSLATAPRGHMCS